MEETTMSKFNNGTKIGLIMELAAIVIMIAMVIMNKQIPDVIVGIFISGMVVAIFSAFVKHK
jgi:hypothetical protein